MKRQQSVLRILTAVALSQLSLPMLADTLAYTATLKSTSVSFPVLSTPSSWKDAYTATTSFGFPQFDPQLGKLTDVSFVTTNTAGGIFAGRIIAKPSIAAGVNANMLIRFTYSPPGLPFSPYCELFFNQSDTFTPDKLDVLFNYPAQSCSTA